MKLIKGFVIVLFLLFLAGCGNGGSATVESNISVVDWKKEGFAVSGEVVDEQGLWVESHIRWDHEDVFWDEETEENFPQLNAVYHDGKIYILYPVIESPDASTVRGVLEIMDTSSLQSEVMELTLEQLGLEGIGEPVASMVVDMDVMGKGNLVFQVVGYDYDKENQFVQSYNGLTYFDMEGNTQQADLLPAYLSMGIREEADHTVSLEGECIIDAAGNSYVIAGTERNSDRNLYAFDRSGTAIMEYVGTDSEMIGAPMKTGGELIFPIWNTDAGNTRLVWFDIETQQPHTLAILEGEHVVQLYGMQGNYLYYNDYNGIVQWNVASGNRQQVFRFNENGISNIYNTMLVLRDGQAPILRTYATVNGAMEDWMMVLSEEPMERSDAVRVVSLTGESTRIKNCTAVASRRNPDYAFEYQNSAGEDMEDFRTQMIAEMAAGGGPDLLYVSREDMELFQRRGLLADLKTLISEETLNEVIPGVIELGTVDGTLMGIAPEVGTISLLIGESVWREDSWTWENVLELMESGRLERRLRDGGGLHASRIALGILLQYSLEDSFLIDWENGQSHFEDERFIRILDNFGKYEFEELEDTESISAGGGGNLITIVGIGSPVFISDFMGTHRVEGSHYVGFPTEHGNGSYLTTDGVLVVNKNLSDPSAVTAYLECLLGEEIQGIANADVGMPVIPLSTDDIWYDSEMGEARWHGQSIMIFKDGMTSIHEVNTFLEGCVPAPRTYKELENIISEETAAYYNGDKSAEDVAKTIDNRIQLYLDERN